MSWEFWDQRTVRIVVWAREACACLQSARHCKLSMQLGSLTNCLQLCCDVRHTHVSMPGNRQANVHYRTEVLFLARGLETSCYSCLQCVQSI